jgi:hypothetical protein
VIGKNLTRIVGEQIYPEGTEMPERGMAPVLQIGRMSVRAEVDAQWNAWYSGEYVPGYRKVPGVIYARRYRVLEGTSGYSTVYEFASTAVPESPEWKETLHVPVAAPSEQLWLSTFVAFDSRR